MMTLNEAIATYLQKSAESAAAKKEADAAKKIIMAAMGDGDEITTDVWTVYAKRTVSTRLDTKALYSDFPDIKGTYGRDSVSVSIDAHARTGAAQKTA